MRDETALAEDESQQVEPPAYHTIEQRILARKLRGLSPPITPETYKISDKKGNKPIVLFTVRTLLLAGINTNIFTSAIVAPPSLLRDHACQVSSSTGLTTRFYFRATPLTEYAMKVSST